MNAYVNMCVFVGLLKKKKLDLNDFTLKQKCNLVVGSQIAA